MYLLWTVECQYRRSHPGVLNHQPGPTFAFVITLTCNNFNAIMAVSFSGSSRFLFSYYSVDYFCCLCILKWILSSVVFLPDLELMVRRENKCAGLWDFLFVLISARLYNTILNSSWNRCTGLMFYSLLHLKQLKMGHDFLFH